MGWTYNKDGKGIAGEYERAGWTIWSAGSGWMITTPNGRTYAREFRTAEAARKYAEKNLMPNIDVIGK